MRQGRCHAGCRGYGMRTLRVFRDCAGIGEFMLVLGNLNVVVTGKQGV